MNLEQEFENETGRDADNDVQYYADWLEEKVEKLTTHNSDYAVPPTATPKSCTRCFYFCREECEHDGDCVNYSAWTKSA